jgi:hypothetical protein
MASGQRLHDIPSISSTTFCSAPAALTTASKSIKEIEIEKYFISMPQQFQFV